MPRLAYGNMWSIWPKADLFLITTNGTVKNNGALVMGAGIAKQAKQKWPKLPFVLGAAIKKYKGEPYHILVSPEYPKNKLGCFQVKHHWADNADLGLIEQGVRSLNWWSTQHNDPNIHLNFPGIGNGKLNIDSVWPIVKHLQDNVVLWQL